MNLFYYFLKRKSSIMLLLTAISVSIAGLTFYSKNLTYDVLQMIIVIALTVCLVAVIYTMDTEFDDGMKDSKKVRRTVFFFACSLLLFQYVSYATLTFWNYTATLGISILGFLYTVPFSISKKRYRLKNIFILKNLMIGLGWGFLLVLGAQNFKENFLLYFIFIFIQVFIGSSLRDFEDIDEDRTSQVQTLPLVLGIEWSFLLLRILNLIVAGILYFSYLHQWLDIYGFIGLFFLCVWREGVFWVYRKNRFNKLIMSIINLMTCGLVSVVRGIEIWMS